MQTYDLLVIGAGPGGYPAAIRAALEELYAGFAAGHLPAGPSEEVLRPFHARVLARQLADCFDRTLDGRGGPRQ